MVIQFETIEKSRKTKKNDEFQLFKTMQSYIIQVFDVYKFWSISTS